MKKIANVKELSHEDWLNLRRKSIGGSDAGCIMGVNNYRSALELYADKLGMVEHTEQNEAMRIGTDLEQYVADRFMEATGKKVQRTNFMYVDDEHEFLSANIDRVVVGENAALECKTMSPLSRYDVAAGEIPATYYYQVQHYMMVMGYEKMYLAFLVFGKGFYWHEIPRNEMVIKAMREAEVNFWNENVLKQIPPEADGSDSAMETLAMMYPNGDDVTVAVPDSKIERYREILDIEKRCKDEKDALKAEICQMLGEHGLGLGEKFACSWKAQNRTTIDNDKLKAEYPDVYEACKKTTSSRAFRTKEIKKKEKK